MISGYQYSPNRLENAVEVKSDAEQIKNRSRMKPGYFKTSDKKAL